MAWIRDAELFFPREQKSTPLRATEPAMGREVTDLHMSLASCSIAGNPPFTLAVL